VKRPERLARDSLRRERANPSTADERNEQRSPLIRLAFVLGPGSDALSRLIASYAPYIDRESGDLVDWLTLGDPRASRPGFRTRFERDCAPMAALESDWKSQLGVFGTPCVAVDSETAILAEKYRIGESKLPIVLVFVAGCDEPLHLRLPRRALASNELAAQVIDRMRSELAPGALEALLCGRQRGSKRVPPMAFIKHLGRLRDSIDRLGTETKLACRERGMWQDDALKHIRDGKSPTAAAKLVGRDRTTLYKNPIVRTAVLAQRLATQKARAELRRGEKSNGVVEAFDSDDVTDA
jgi:hypothetical protein